VAKKKRKKREILGTHVINVYPPTKADAYLGRLDAQMTRKALRLAKKRKLAYIA
jgi:hypothetical protein